jgi:hypothetical protein
MKLIWEQIDDNHSRAMVFGGWLVKAFECVVHYQGQYGRGMVDGWDFRVAMCFVPDPNHEWN